MTDDTGACTERELTAPVALCRADGTLEPDAVGWARTPLIDCTLHGSWGRRKRWDFWCVTGPGFVMNLTIADVDYLGLGDVWFHDLATGATATAAAMVPLGRGMDLHPRAGKAPSSSPAGACACGSRMTTGVRPSPWPATRSGGRSGPTCWSRGPLITSR